MSKKYSNPSLWANSVIHFGYSGIELGRVDTPVRCNEEGTTFHQFHVLCICDGFVDCKRYHNDIKYNLNL